VVLEMVYSDNVVFLKQADLTSASSESHYRFTPQFASGCLFTSSMLDSFTCQQFYYPELISVINQLVAGNNMSAEDEMLTAIDRIPRSNLYQIAVTSKMIKDTPTYGMLFSAMSEKKQTCLGLFRGIVPENGCGPKVSGWGVYCCDFLLLPIASCCSWCLLLVVRRSKYTQQ
jgi:hypothetical protein